MKVSIVVFEINEVDGMRAMMPRIRKEWYDELIIVDGGSTDGTIEYAKDEGFDLFVQKERGVGAALKEAMERVTGDIIVIYAPDGSFIPEIIPQMIEKVKAGYDVVNVSRYGFGASSEDDNVFTAMGNRTFTFLANVFFPFHFTDFLYTYLGFRRSVLNHLDMAAVTEITWGQILLLRAVKKGLKIIEIPGNEPPRVGGKVKVAKMRAAYALVKTIYEERFVRPWG
jgi:glycosyltransferase involved in cell wall biosynthesis